MCRSRQLERNFYFSVSIGGYFLTLKSNDLSDSLQKFGLGAEGAQYVSAKLKFLVRREGRKSKQISVEIKPPESSKVPQRKEKQIIEDYL